MMMIKSSPSFLFPFSILRTTPISILLHLSFSSSSKDQNPPPKSNFMRDYLITSCGFSPLKAATSSKHIAYVNSPDKPDSVRHFFKHHGFTDAYIRKIISSYPYILCTDVEKTLQPNINALRQLGLSDHELWKFIARNPQALILRSAIPRIEFWKDFLKNDMQKLLLAFTRNLNLITLDIDKNVAPRISLLNDYGLSCTQIRMILGRGGSLFKRSTTSLEVLLKRVQELGFPRGSSMFALGLAWLDHISPHTFKAKMELFKSLGWTEGEFITALNKCPAIISLSETNIREKMMFFVDRAGCTQSYIAYRPKLLSYNLKKRLIPRFQVVNILKSNGSTKIKVNLFSIMSYSERSFLEKIVVPHQEFVPILHELYVAACKGLL